MFLYYAPSSSFLDTTYKYILPLTTLQTNLQINIITHIYT